jgi:conjugal transfer pilus assembly protein TraW
MTRVFPNSTLWYVFLFIGLGHLCCHGKNLGVHGPVFAIEERDLLEVIQAKLKHLEQTGKIRAINGQIVERVKQRVLHPKPSHLPTVTDYQSRVFDPSFVVKKDIKDHEGQIVASKGTTINPLDYFSWGTPIVLLNGEDMDQIAWAKTIKAKWVLVKGSPIEVSKAQKRRVYFDQGSKIIQHFGINKVPTKISQKGKILILEEIPPVYHGRS